MFSQSEKRSQLIFKQYSTEIAKQSRGLSQSTVLTIHQDKFGYIWFGTWDGLNRYDAYEFKVYKSSFLLNNKELSSVIILDIEEDAKGNLWIATDMGLNYFDRKKNRFYKQSTLFDNQPNAKFIQEILLEDSMLYVAGKDGLFVVRLGSFFFSPDVYKFRPCENFIVHKLYSEQNGNIWIASNCGLFLINPKAQKIEKVKNRDEGLELNHIFDVLRDAHEESLLWLATLKGLMKFNTKSFIAEKIPLNSTSIDNREITAISLLQDGEGNIWTGTRGSGLFIYNHKNRRIDHYLNTFPEEGHLSSNHILSLMQDEAGSIWIGTRKGVNKVNKSSGKFNHYYNLPDARNIMNNNVIWSIYVDQNDDIWLGTENGISIFNRQNNVFLPLQNYQGKDIQLTSKDIRKILPSKDANIWIATNGGGINYLDMATGALTIFQKDNDESKIELHNNYVLDICEDTSGALWVGTYLGLARIDMKNNSINTFYAEHENPHSLSDNLVYDVYFDRSHRLWVGTNNGLNRYMSESKTFKTYFHEPGNDQTLTVNKIFDIYQDQKGVFWIGTMSGGLNRFDPETEIFSAYTETDGLADNVVYEILEDDQGNLWMSTNKGISKFNKSDQTFTNFDILDGLQSYEFNLGAAFKSAKGEMFFGGMNGFNGFFPKDIQFEDNPINTVITKFELPNRIYSMDVRNEDTIFLKSYENFFSITFSSLDYLNPDKSRYKYRLENFEKRWNYTDADNRIAQYTGISPGSYVFHVLSANSDGNWEKEGIRVHVLIENPWWAKLNFLIPVGSFLIIIIAFFTINQVKKIKAKSRKQKEILAIEKQLFELEQKALRLQMNPHFIFNTMNSLQNFILKNNQDDAIAYLTKLSKLMRLILSNTREAYVPLQNEIDLIRYYMDIEKLRFDDKFNYKIILDSDLDQESIAIPPMVIQPFIENAILHGVLHKKDKGEISVRIGIIDEMLECIIIDDGVGRSKAEELKKKTDLQHKSLAINITRERLNLLTHSKEQNMNVLIEDRHDENGNAIGTKVKIYIPFIETL